MSLEQLVLVLVAVVLAVLVYLLVRWSLRALLDDVVRLPAGRTFYLRTLLLTLVLGALAATVSQSSPAKNTFMETVWAIAGDLSSTLGTFLVVLLIFVTLVTILVAVLRRRNEQ